jgi:hypothetical protein
MEESQEMSRATLVSVFFLMAATFASAGNADRSPAELMSMAREALGKVAPIPKDCGVSVGPIADAHRKGRKVVFLTKLPDTVWIMSKYPEDPFEAVEMLGEIYEARREFVKARKLYKSVLAPGFGKGWASQDHLCGDSLTRRWDCNSPDDAAAWFYYNLGIGRTKKHHSGTGRPVNTVRSGPPIRPLFS